MEIWDAWIIFGIAIGVLGCFSPWGEYCESFWPFVLIPRAGTDFLSGVLCLYGFISVAVFQLVFMLERKMYSIFAVLILGLVTLIISGNWVLNTDFSPHGRFFFGY